VSILVTVDGAGRSVDLELDDTRPVADLLSPVADALAAPMTGVLRAADGRDLDPADTLAEAGVLDGQRLTYLPAAGSLPGDAPEPAAGGRSPVLPCYLALDTSDSMAGAALDAVNAELARLFDALRHDPRVAQSCRVAVLTFDAEARIDLPLTLARDLGVAPRLAATRPATDYEAAFRLLHRQIARDLEGLRMAGLRPLRPAIFFLTDGRPTRGYWPPAHAALTDPGWEGAADFLAFGFGDAAEPAVRRVGTAAAYMPAAAPGAPAARPAGMLAAVMAFVMEAVGHPATGGVAVPAGPPTGWRSLHELIR
jgi:uncharacterized protein YegL